MGLADLCPEILFQICELFCEHCQGEWYGSRPPPEWWRFFNPHSTLLALSLVCKSIGPIAQRVLHHHFGHGITSYDTTALFCRTISSNPELAKDLRWADLSRLIRSETLEDIVEGWLPNDINKLSRHLLHGGQGIPYVDLLTATILLQAPNLEHLEDQGGSGREACKFLNWDAVVRDGALPPDLKHLCLRSCTYGSIPNRKVWMDLSWDGIGAFIEAFKELESLTVHFPLASGVDERLSFQSLRVLRLYEFYLPAKDFEKLISLMPHLEEFAISRLANFSRSPSPATVPEILQTLAQRNNSLRRLELDISCTHDDVWLLNGLTNLEELEMVLGRNEVTVHRHRGRISKQAFVGIMPPSLRKLHFHSYEMRAFERAKDALMTYISSTCRERPDDQRLRTVHFDVAWKSESWEARQRDIFQQECQEWAKNGTLTFGTGIFNWDIYLHRATRNSAETDQRFTSV